jgi:hypothetical protein
MEADQATNAADRGSELSEGLGLPVAAEAVPAPRTTDLFVLLVRYGKSHWASASSHPTAEKAAEAATNQAAYLSAGEAWRIVRVRGLPVSVAAGEAA